MTLYIVNETTEDFSGFIEWRLESFFGEALGGGKFEAEAKENASVKIASVDFKTLLKEKGKDCVFIAELVGKDGIIARKTALFDKEKRLNLPKSDMSVSVKTVGETAYISLVSKTYARYVGIEIEEITQPLSDNFFDMTANEERTVAVKTPSNWDGNTVLQKMKIRAAGDVEPGATEFQDFMYKVKTNLKPMNIIKRIGYILGI
jgi:hypothetical protein